MQQDAIPFKQSPRTFVITVFALIAIVYITLLFGKYAIPPFVRKILAFRIRELDELVDVRGTAVVEDEPGAALQKGQGQIKLNGLGARALRGATAV